MRDRYLITIIGIDATPLKATSPFHHPEMFPQLPAIQVDLKLLRPESKEAIETIHTGVGIAIMPAIDQAKGLVMPVPVPAGMDRAIHRGLHLIEIIYLVIEGLIVNATNVRIKRTK